MTRCSGGDGGVDGGDDDDDDGDDVPLDDDGDGVDFPLREGISPADSCPPESSFLSGVLRPAEAAVTLRALPQIIANTDKAFFENAMDVMRKTAEICYQKLMDIECITCPHKPEGSMFVMVKLDLSSLDGIDDDIDFCNKVAREESVVICPGM
ncbi:hypothetical protein QYE76_007574 [Lolium multiflorum]|uniref:Tyrosine aminotransferase n=1 Tax=Lolium multiflorum TaxID=4521 RepID=A0AAD8PJZ0_LOLMU|nr:hypothetical protein QYE76_007574 [Lolium multiflorum]